MTPKKAGDTDGAIDGKRVFGGLIAVILLGLYTYAVIEAVLTATCAGTPGCTEHPVSGFTSGFANVLAIVGGLVSALVIAELALTKPGEAPLARVFGIGSNVKAAAVLKWVTRCYLLIWLACGAAAFVVGTMQHPDVLPALTDLGKSWLGLAVAAGASYLGITPS